MFSVFFPGTLTAGWLHLAVLTGLSFLAGCILAGLYTKRDDLLVMVTMPPMVFLVAVICVKALTATGSALISTAEGCILTLSAAAPWLFGGVAPRSCANAGTGAMAMTAVRRMAIRRWRGRGNLIAKV